jgi:hypothetical protein
VEGGDGMGCSGGAVEGRGGAGIYIGGAWEFGGGGCGVEAPNRTEWVWVRVRDREVFDRRNARAGRDEGALPCWSQ